MSYWEDYLDATMEFNNSDPLQYHILLNFRSIIRETAKAYLIEMDLGRMWIPASICRFIDLEQREMWVHEKTFRKLEGILVGYNAEDEFS